MSLTKSSLRPASDSRSIRLEIISVAWSTLDRLWIGPDSFFLSNFTHWGIDRDFFQEYLGLITLIRYALRWINCRSTSCWLKPSGYKKYQAPKGSAAHRNGSHTHRNGNRLPTRLFIFCLNVYISILQSLVYRYPLARLPVSPLSRLVLI
jgi:hypothetical protein